MERINSNHILILVFILISVFSDLKTKKIQNKFLLIFLGIGVFFQIAFTGITGLWISISSFLAAVLLGLPLYLMKIFGGGDYKLLLAVSVLMDWKTTTSTIILSFVWGALLGLFQVIFKGQGLVLITNIYSILKRQPSTKITLHMIPFSVAILFGFISAISTSHLDWGLG